MKKFLALVLSTVMLLALCAALIVPASAVDGSWWVYCSKGYYDEDFEGDEPSIVGYEYTEEGLRVIPADWRDHKPAAGFQTKEKVDLKEGVYMLVRIDEFTFANDKWFDINIWDSVMVSPGSTDVAKNGSGVQNLIRPSDAGDVSGITWYKEGFTGAGNSTMAADAEKKDADGKILLALTVTWDGTNYAVDINGAKAPDAIVQYMKEKWGGSDSEAYIGMNMQNSNKGGTVGCTVLKFGTSKENATVPVGDDSRDPVNSYIEIEEIQDPSNIPAGKPAVFMNGSKENSDSKTNHGKSATGISSLNEDYSIRYAADKANIEVSFTVKNSVSYDAEDFPVAVALTRNLCTCGEDDCYALESTNMYICNGAITGAADAYRISELSMCYDPIIHGEDSYLYFYTDLSEDASFDYTGRINGCRFDIKGVDYQTAGKNTFDVCWVAYFRTVEEAEKFIYEWIGIDNTTDCDTTEPDPTPTETEPKVDTETDEVITPATSEKQTGVVTEETEPEEVTTEDKADGATTEKKEDDKKEDDKKEDDKKEEKTDAPAKEEGGCGSSVGFGAIAIVAVAAVAGMVSFKKKD